MAEVIRRYEAEGLTPRELERARRELRASLALARLDVLLDRLPGDVAVRS